MSKYDKLSKYLAAMDKPELQLSFADVEKVLGFSLPRSAYQYPAWWANDETGHSHAAAWLSAGWKTENVNVSHRQVKLVRTVATPAAGGRLGCMHGTAWLQPGTDLTAPLGGGVAASEGRLTND